MIPHHESAARQIAMVLTAAGCLFVSACGGGGSETPDSQAISAHTSTDTSATLPLSTTQEASGNSNEHDQLNVQALSTSHDKGNDALQTAVTEQTVRDAQVFAEATISIRTTAQKPYLNAQSTYAIDSVGGSDTNPGTIQLPWKTLSKLIENRLPINAQVNLACGSIWRESISLDENILSDGVTIRSYGTNCAIQPPRITGSDILSGGWVKSGLVWSKPISITSQKLTRLFVNGTPMRVAQWPNAGNTPLIVPVSSSNGTTVSMEQAAIAALQGQPISDATIQLRTRPWIAETRRVLSLNSNTALLTLDMPTAYIPEAGRSFVLQDKQWMLDSPGEFFHDTANGTLYLYPPSLALQSNLNNAVIEGSTRSTPLTLRGRARVSVTGIKVDMANADGLKLTAMPGAVVDGVEASNNSVSGIRVDSTISATERVTIKNSRFDGNLNYGILALTSSSVDVANNTVTNTGANLYDGPTSAAIRIGPNSSATDNLVDGAGYHGIHFTGNANTRVVGNQIKNYCLRFPDCGGIYTWNGPKSARQTVNQLSLVENNLVFSASAVTSGLSTGGADLVAGIYIDDYSQGVTIRNNVVYDNAWGIFLHNASSNLVENNKLWRIREAGLVISMDQTDADYSTNNVFRSNQIVPISAMASAFPAVPSVRSALGVSFSTALNVGSQPIVSGSNSFIANQIVLLQGQSQLPVASLRAAGNTSLYTASQWLPLTSGDFLNQSLGTFKVYTSQVGAELLPNGAFDSGNTGWSSYFSRIGLGGSVVYTSGFVGCSDTCARYISGSTDDSLISPTLSLAAGKLHTIRYRAGFTTSASLRKPYIARAASPWDSFVGSEGLTITSGTFGSANTVVDFEAYFRPTSSVAAKINLKLETTGVPVSIDNVSVREVTGYNTARPEDWIAIASAPRSVTANIDCLALGWPSGCQASLIDGTAVSFPISLAAGTAKLLIRTDSPWRQ